MNLFAKEQQKSNEKAKICYIWKEKCDNKYTKDKKYRKVRDHRYYSGQHRGSVHIIWSLKYSLPDKIPIAFHDGSS